jgi:carboxypeptidase Q
MIRPVAIALFGLLVITGFPVASQENDSVTIRKMYTEALTHPVAYNRLDYLCNSIGGRLCGSPEAEKALQYIQKVMESMELDSIRIQTTPVKHWVRGEPASGKVSSKAFGDLDLHITALGSSIGTGKEGIRAEVVEVQNFEELKKLGRKNIEGKIVFYNRAADPALVYTFDAYGGAADQRARGAMHAARYGAIGVVVRSVTLAHDDYPHTGIQHYADSVNKIPALAISTRDADKLSFWLKNDPHLSLFMRTQCHELEETMSYNLIGEIKGSGHPEEIIAFGGHIDSWDIGQGAHDDGAGVVQTLEILRLFRQLGIRPKHTLRCVVFMDEEYDQRGAKVYEAGAGKMIGKQRHIAAIEADRGGFTPSGFSIDASDTAFRKILSWKPLLQPYGLWSGG